MSKPFNEKHITYYKQMQSKLDAHRTKSSLIEFRRHILERQRIANYQNDYDQIVARLHRSAQPFESSDRLRERVKKLEQLFGNSLKNPLRGI